MLCAIYFSLTVTLSGDWSTDSVTITQDVTITKRCSVHSRSIGG